MDDRADTPLDLAELQRLCEIPRPTPTYRTGSYTYTPEFERDWERFAQARRDMANAVPQLIHDLTTLRARVEQQETRYAQLLADRDRWEDVARTEHMYTQAAEAQAEQFASALAEVREQNEQLTMLLREALETPNPYTEMEYPFCLYCEQTALWQHNVWSIDHLSNCWTLRAAAALRGDGEAEDD